MFMPEIISINTEAQLGQFLQFLQVLYLCQLVLVFHIQSFTDQKLFQVGQRVKVLYSLDQVECCQLGSKVHKLRFFSL